MSNLIKANDGSIAVLPDYLKEVKSSVGLEDIGMQSLTVPRLSLLQSSSKIVKRNLARNGQFYNSITKEEIGDTIELIIIKAKAGAVCMDMDDGLKCKSEDGKVNMMNGGKCSECWLGSYYNDWTKGKPACSATFDLIVVDRKTILDSIPAVMAFTLRTTAYKLGKDLLSRAKFLNKPLYSQAYNFGSIYKDHPKGGYQDLIVEYKGWVTPEEFEAAHKIYEGFSNKAYVIDDEIQVNVETPVKDDSIGF